MKRPRPDPIAGLLQDRVRRPPPAPDDDLSDEWHVARVGVREEDECDAALWYTTPVARDFERMRTAFVPGTTRAFPAPVFRHQLESFRRVRFDEELVGCRG